MVATFHLHCLGHRVKYGNPELRNTTQKFLSTTRPCCSIEFMELSLFWVILVTYNIGIYICIYIYEVSYIHSFFVISNCSVFSALHAKHFEIWKKYFVKLTSRLLHSAIHHVMCYFWVFIVNPFFYAVFFFSRKLCLLSSSCHLLITELISLDTSSKLTVGFFLKITSFSWIKLSVLLDELNSMDWLLKSWWWIFLKQILFYCCKRILQKMLEAFWKIYLNIIGNVNFLRGWEGLAGGRGKILEN